MVSRESSFLFNNLILLASCFAVLWGTLFPVISEAVTGEKISVDAPWFNRLMVPIGLFLLFLTGVGPLIAWRRSSLDSLKRAFLVAERSRAVADDRLSLAAGMRHRLRADLVRPLPVRDGRRSSSSSARARRPFAPKNGMNLLAGDGRADASQHAALRRIPGPHGHRARCSSASPAARSIKT